MASFLFKLRFFPFLICWLAVISLFGCGDLEADLSSLTISPSVVTVGVNQSKLFAVTARDTAGFIIKDIVPTWSADSSIGTIVSSGLFMAGNAAGQGSVQASYGGKTDSATVTVTENGWIEGLVQSMLGVTQNKKVYLRDVPSLYDYTDSDGKYSIADVPAGTYWMVTEADTVFQSASQEVTVGRGQTASGKNFYLETQPGVPSVPTTTIPSI